MLTVSDEKWRLFNCFSVQRTSGSPPGPDPEIRVGDQYTGIPGIPLSCGMHVQVEPGHCRARTRPLGALTEAFFLQNILHLH